MTRKTTTKKGSNNYSLRALVPIPFNPQTDPDKETSELEQKTIEIPIAIQVDRQTKACENFCAHGADVYHMDNAYIRQHTYLLYDTHMGEKF